MTHAIQLAIRTDRTLLRATARSTHFLHMTLSAPVAPPRDADADADAARVRLPMNVGLVLDRSGSMGGEDKFPLAVQAIEQSLALLQPQDRFTLVVYDNIVDTIMSNTLATADAKRVALQRLSEIQPRGGTDLYAGWMTGAAQMLEQMSRDAVNRVLLLTDGLANAGMTEPSGLLTAAEALRGRGIGTTTFGVGNDFDERLLRDIAHNGGGQFYFVGEPAQIPEMVTSELGEALQVVRRNAALQITLPPGAESELLNRYRTTHTAGDHALRVELGDLTSGQELTLVVRLTFPEDREGATTSVRVGIAGLDALSMDAECELSWTYADHAATEAQPRLVLVDREVATLYAARARAEATEANRQGDYRRATRVLEGTARRIRSYANGDPVLDTIWRTLLAELEMYAERSMSAKEMKMSFYAAESQGKNRDAQGKARRQPR